MTSASPQKVGYKILNVFNKLKLHYLVFLIIFGKTFYIFYAEWKQVNAAFSRSPFSLDSYVGAISWFVWRLFYLYFSESVAGADHFLLAIVLMLIICLFRKRILPLLCFVAVLLTVAPMAYFLPQSKTQHILYVPTALS